MLISQKPQFSKICDTAIEDIASEFNPIDEYFKNS